MSISTEQRLVEQAAEAAEAAAGRAGVHVLPVTGADAARQVSRLFADVWGMDDPRLVSAEIVRAVVHAGGYASRATAGGVIVGAAFGFFGYDGRDFYLHSDIAGVIESYRGSNVGFALKQHQRAWALQRGFDRITWTFDPLVRRNAYFNLVKLGAKVIEFHPNFYGEMEDSVNGGDESDRILVEWNLGSPGVVAASRLEPQSVDPALLDGHGPVRRLRVGGDGGPAVDERTGRVELCQIPEDIVALRSAEPEIARRWRLALRETLGDALADGALVAGITRDGWYALQREDGS